MKPCKFTFDDTPAFAGFSHGSKWNGFDNVAVTPEVLRDIADYFEHEGDPDTARDLLAIAPMEDGRISLGWGYTTTIEPDRDQQITLIAGRFAEVLRSWLTPEEFTAMQRMNREDPRYAYPICASHDFCDANMAMMEAFESVTGSTLIPEEGDIAEADTKLWNDAWDHARNNSLI
jgi:hypothetical protein